jgi:hypothetical protein
MAAQAVHRQPGQLRSFGEGDYAFELQAPKFEAAFGCGR